MNSSNQRKSWLYGLCLGLEWTLLFYICLVPIHVYFFPEMWAVQVVDSYSEPRVWTEPGFFVDSKPLPQVMNASDFSPPIDTWKFYVLGVGYFFVKVGRIGPRRAWSNFKGNVKNLRGALYEHDR